MNNKSIFDVIDKREYGIDLVKIFATFLVVLTHMYTFGGFNEKIDVLSFNGVTFGFFEGLSICCVNLFCFSTGYLYYNKRVKIAKIFLFWIQVLFLSVVVLFIFSIFNGGLSVIKHNFFISICPFFTKKYWFFTEYIGLLLLLNYYNILIDKINKKKFTVLLISLSFLFIIFPLISGTDLFCIYSGYSIFWISFCFFCGAYIKKFSIAKKYNSIICFPILILSLFITPLYKLLYSIKNISLLPTGNYERTFLNYNSLNIFIASIIIFILFLKIKINNDFCKKMLRLFSSASFAVFIIHCSDVFYQNYILNKFTYITDFFLLKGIGVLLLATFIIFLVCSVIGILQVKLFKIIKIDILCNKIEIAVNNVFNKLYKEE